MITNIWNPLKKKFVSTQTEVGKDILKNYIQYYNTIQSGGAVIDVLEVSGLMDKQIDMKKLIEAYKRAGDIGVISTFDKNHAMCRDTNILLTRNQYKLKNKEKIPNFDDIFALKIGSKGFYKKIVNLINRMQEKYIINY